MNKEDDANDDVDVELDLDQQDHDLEAGSISGKRLRKNKKYYATSRSLRASKVSASVLPVTSSSPRKSNAKVTFSVLSEQDEYGDDSTFIHEEEDADHNGDGGDHESGTASARDRGRPDDDYYYMFGGKLGSSNHGNGDEEGSEEEGNDSNRDNDNNGDDDARRLITRGAQKSDDQENNNNGNNKKKKSYSSSSNSNIFNNNRHRRQKRPTPGVLRIGNMKCTKKICLAYGGHLLCGVFCDGISIQRPP
jgi:hypothetical protein